MKKSLKQFIFDSLDSGKYLTDTDVYKFRNKEEDIITATDYISEYRRIQRDEDFWRDRKLVKLHNYRRTYVGYDDRGSCYRISKSFYNKKLPLYERDMSRPDLTDVYDYNLK